MPRVSFDFDDTLDQEEVWHYALELIDRGIDVWIVTARLDDDNVKKEYGTEIGGRIHIPWYAGNDALYQQAKAMGIPKDQIVFTNLMGKGKWFKKHSNFLWHLDDSPKQLFDIKYVASVPAINVLNPHWKEKCEKLIKDSDTHGYVTEWAIPDLAPYDYSYKESNRVVNPKELAVGWLDDPNFPIGETPPGFLEKLKQIQPIEHHKGSHICPFGDDEKSSTMYGIYGNKKTYIFPGMLYHYITVHHYLPPQEFIDLVMSGKFRNKKPTRKYEWS